MVVALVLAILLACIPEIHEQCPLITEKVQAPVLPADFARVDALLIQRAVCMTNEVQQLRGSLARSFRIYFAYDTLPPLCARLQQARQLAASGKARSAGKKYQALLVAAQVIELAIAVHAFSEYSDGVGVPAGEIVQMQSLFGDQMVPLLDAALSEDPVRIQRALAEHGAQYGAWVEAFGRWSSQVNAQVPRLRVAKLVWDVGMLVVATHEAAGAAAELAASGRPPVLPMPVLVEGGGAAAAGMSQAAYLELADALRRLIASGALDATVVVGLAHLGASGSPPPELPTSFQMSAGGEETTAPGPLRFTQTTASPVFSNDGSFAGRSISQVAAELRSGALKPAEVPVEFIARDGNRLIVNTRSVLPLREAGVPEAQWNLVDRTGSPVVEKTISERLAHNGLGSAGTDVVRITGSGTNASSYQWPP